MVVRASQGVVRVVMARVTTRSQSRRALLFENQANFLHTQQQSGPNTLYPSSVRIVEVSATDTQQVIAYLIPPSSIRRDVSVF